MAFATIRAVPQRAMEERVEPVDPRGTKAAVTGKEKETAMRFVTVALVAAAATAVWLSRRRRGYGSNTNASDAVDNIELGSNPTNEERVDASVMGTFPASDPPATDDAGESAYARQKRGAAPAQQPKAAARRSPDWLLTPPR